MYYNNLSIKLDNKKIQKQKVLWFIDYTLIIGGRYIKRTTI